jgi:hypothetical protein
MPALAGAGVVRCGREMGFVEGGAVSLIVVRGIVV